jgi:hypothetical protein
MIDPVVDAFVRGDAAAVAAQCAPDVLLDANVPTWRYQLQGRSALRSQLDEAEFVPGREVVSWRSASSDDGVLLEIESAAPVHGERHQWRQLCWFRGVSGAWAEVVIYCTGIWDAPTVARQAAEAPMVTA